MSSNPSDTENPSDAPEVNRSGPPEADVLPDWAQEVPRRRRFISRRNAIIGVVALIVIGFVVWLNFPFIPDPVILWGRQPETVFDSASTGQAWTMAGRNLGQTRYAADVLDGPQGRLAWSADTGEGTLAAPIVSGGRIYLGAALPHRGAGCRNGAGTGFHACHRTAGKLAGHGQQTRCITRRRTAGWWPGIRSARRYAGNTRWAIRRPVQYR